MTIRDHLTATSRVRTLTAALCALLLSTAALSAEPLRVCADPDNLPFSKSDGPEHGLYVDLAELVAKKLEATPIQYTWWLTFNQRRALRNTAGECDAVFALPTDADYKARGLQKTPAFLDVGYAVVAPPSFKFNSLNDFKGKRLAVQFQTTPHILLSQLEGFTFTTYRNSDEVFAALAKGEVDASFLWGPVAGYENMKRHKGRWKVTPLTGSDMSGQVSVAVRRDKPELAKNIEAALTALKPEIAALADKYGFPRSKPVDIAQASMGRTETASSVSSTPAQAQAPVKVPSHLVALIQQKPTDEALPAAKAASKQKQTAAAKNAKVEKPAAAVEALVAAMSEKATLGRVRFNDQCSHCHGTDGASPLRERDLRRIKLRYDAKWMDTALTTIKNGRAELGMPPWKDILAEAEIQQLLSFLETQQK
jgi:polar amino acid transport system substrate-binding protein